MAAVAAALTTLTVSASSAEARVEPDAEPKVVVAGDLSTRNHEVAYNPERDEYYAVWDDFGGGLLRGVIFGQRLAANGTPLGSVTLIAAQGTNGDGDLLQGAFMPPKVAYNAATNQYLVVFGREASGSPMIENRRVAVVLGRLISDQGLVVGGEAPLNPPLGTPDPGFFGACYPRYPDVVADPGTGGYALAYTKIFYGFPQRGSCDGLGSEVTTTLQALDGSLGLGTRVDVLTNSSEGIPIARIGHNPVTNQIMVTRSFTEVRGGANRFGRRFEAQVFTSALAPVSPIRTIDVDPVESNSGSVVTAIPVGDPVTGNWFVVSTAFFDGPSWMNLLSPSGESLRTGTRADAGMTQSVAAVGDGTFVFSTSRGNILHVRADGTEIHRSNPFPASIYETPGLAIGRNGSGVAVGIGVTDTVAVGFDVVAPGVLPVVPARLLETRTGAGLTTVDGLALGEGPVSGGQVKVLQVAGRGGVPTDASAVNLNITVARAASDGFATMYPCDAATRPNTSNLNYTTGAAASAAAFARLSATGTVCVFTSATVDVIVDVNGFVPEGGSVEPLVPERLMDTRATGMTVDTQAQATGRVAAGVATPLKVTGRGGVSADADAVIVNVTAVRPSLNTFVTVYPCDEDLPTASNLNAAANAVVNNLVVAKVSAAGTICLVSSAETDLLVDVAAYVPNGGGLLPVVPARLLETRSTGTTIDNVSQTTSPVAAESVTSLRVAGRGGVSTDASGAVLNVTAIRPDDGGFITAYPCDEERPDASNVNFRAGAVVANAVVVKLSASGTVCLYTTARTNLAVDVVAYSVDS